MNINDRIMNDLKESMKNKDSFKLSVIRMVKGAIQLEKINKKRDLTDEEVIDVISKQIKLRKDSINEFTKAGRNDLVENTQKEVEILNEYMPEQLSSEEVNKIIDEAFLKLNPTSSKDMGLIIKEVSPKVKGRTDMGEVSKIIKDKLSQI